MEMQVWAVAYDPSRFTNDLYQKGLLLVDADSSARIKRFYRREDACRGLIARVLPRMLLSEQGITPDAMKFSATEAGKPYITTPLQPPIAYNLSHDNGFVVMSFASAKTNPPAYSLGVDVMKVRMPQRESYRSFIDTFQEQLTSVEQRLLSPAIPEAEGIRRFFWIWTLKEAYTKALGLGLGFDFSRIEFDVVSDTVRIDGREPRGWQFHKFQLMEGEDLYVGVVAELLGDSTTVVISETEPNPWLKSFEANSFMKRAIQELGEI